MILCLNKPLPGNLKYAYLDEKKIYHVTTSANLSEQEEERLFKTLKRHRASIAMPPTDLLEQYLLDHENDMFMNERREIDEVFLQHGPILKHNLPVEILGDPLHPR